MDERKIHFTIGKMWRPRWGKYPDKEIIGHGKQHCVDEIFIKINDQEVKSSKRDWNDRSLLLQQAFNFTPNKLIYRAHTSFIILTANNTSKQVQGGFEAELCVESLRNFYLLLKKGHGCGSWVNHQYSSIIIMSKPVLQKPVSLSIYVHIYILFLSLEVDVYIVPVVTGSDVDSHVNLYVSISIVTLMTSDTATFFFFIACFVCVDICLS